MESIQYFQPLSANDPKLYFYIPTSYEGYKYNITFMVSGCEDFKYESIPMNY